MDYKKVDEKDVEYLRTLVDAVRLHQRFLKFCC